MKNYLCSAARSPWFQDTCWLNPCWMGGLRGKEANCCHEGTYKISLWGWIQLPRTYSPAVRLSGKWEYLCLMSWKIFWPPPPAKPEMPEDPSPAWCSSSPKGHPITSSGLLIVQYRRLPRKSQGMQGRICEWCECSRNRNVNHLINTCRNEHSLLHKGNQLKRKNEICQVICSQWLIQLTLNNSII